MSDVVKKLFALYDNFLLESIDYKVKVTPSVTIDFDCKPVPVKIKVNSALLAIIIALSIAVIDIVSAAFGVYLHAEQSTNLPSILIPIYVSKSALD